MTGALSLSVNARAIDAIVEPRTPLADFLRDKLDLTGTHLGCEHGVCGACTLLIDGEPARSCITYAIACDGAAVTTIEGLDDDEIAGELRAAFTREHALQCGYCTPGMLISARDLVIRLPDDDKRAIRLGLSGNLCRCTGYVGIVRAVRGVIAARRARGIAAKSGGWHRQLGPVGSTRSSALRTLPASKPAVARPAAPMTSTAEIPDFQPTASFDERFVLPFPPERVAAFFADTAAVAACLPGASLTATPSAERAEGAMRVKLGPISAEFRGAAKITRAPDALSGRILGLGSDGRSGSSTQGEIAYRLTPADAGASTQIDLAVGYRLGGLLAQVARAGLVREIARRVIAAFAGNLGAHLAGETADHASAVQTAQGAPTLNAAALVSAMLRDSVTARWQRFRGRKRTRE